MAITPSLTPLITTPPVQSSDCSLITIADVTVYGDGSSQPSAAQSALQYVITLKKTAGDEAIATLTPTPATSVNQAVTEDGGYEIVQTISENVAAGSPWTNNITGTVAVTQNDPNIVGSGTSFTTELIVGDILKINGRLYEILTITDNTNIILTSNYIDATASGLTASLSYNFAVTHEFASVCLANTCLMKFRDTINNNSICNCEDSETEKLFKKLDNYIEGAKEQAEIRQNLSRSQKLIEAATDLCIEEGLT